MDYLLGNNVADTGNGTHGTTVDYLRGTPECLPRRVVKDPRFCW